MIGSAIQYVGEDWSISQDDNGVHLLHHGQPVNRRRVEVPANVEQAYQAELKRHTERQAAQPSK